MKFILVESDYEGYTEEQVKDIIARYIEQKIRENYFDVAIREITLIGSRKHNRNRKDSDLDVLLEYEGSEREDDLFNLLHEDDFMIDDMLVDINPINRENMTTAEYLEKDKEYEKSKK